MEGTILAYPTKPYENYPLSVGNKPVVKITEERILVAKGFPSGRMDR